MSGRRGATTKSWQLTTKTASQSGTMIKNQLGFSTDALPNVDAIFTVKGPIPVIEYAPPHDFVYSDPVQFSSPERRVLRTQIGLFLNVQSKPI